MKRVAAVLASVVALTTLAACGTSSSDEPRIVTGLYPLAWVAERVAGDHYQVVNLTRPGQEPHDLELGPAQVAQVAQAPLVIHEHGVQPAVDAAIAENADGEVLDVADVVHLRHFPDSDDVDPHFWQDPRLMATFADALAQRLGKLDPDHAATYVDNAESLGSELSRLDDEYRTGLASCRRTDLVVNHDAFGYLARYGLRVEPIVGLSPDAEPTAGALSRLHKLIEDKGLTTVFSESLVSPKTAETLAHDLGIEAEVLDPIEGLTSATKDEDYLSLMRGNLAKIEAANACG